MVGQDKLIALVTGANQGIGLQLVKELVKHNYFVFLGSRDEEKGKDAIQKELSTHFNFVECLQLDVTDPRSIQRAANDVEKAYGHLDLLIQNAAISRADRREGESGMDYIARTKASLISMQEVRTIWETNVFGVLQVYQAFVHLLRKSPTKSAQIINVGSGAGSLSSNVDPEWSFRQLYTPGYGVSKTALNGLSVAMAMELEKDNIPVNLISPGYIKTNLNGYEGSGSLEEGVREIVRVALIEKKDRQTNRFTRWEGEVIPW